MNVIWTYVQVGDDGGAPNFEAPNTTLAICKPIIRRCAKAGDMVLAFNGKPLSREPHSVRWAGVVVEIIPFADYWRDTRFRNKRPDLARTMPDNIYRPGPVGLVQEPNRKHGLEAATKDLRGRNVLVFGKCWRFAEGVLLPARFNLRIPRHARRGQRKHPATGSAREELEKWLDQNAARSP